MSCAACLVMGPLLTAPGTSGRVWICGCGERWGEVPDSAEGFVARWNAAALARAEARISAHTDRESLAGYQRLVDAIADDDA
jgi:hypothetical protein